MRPSVASADASANDGTTSGRVSPEERRRLRSLLCGAGSARLSGRTPDGGGGGVGWSVGGWEGEEEGVMW